MSKPVQAITPAALAQLEECIDPWPAPEVIDDGLSAVEAFNLRFLPESFRSWVADIAERMQVPLDFPAVIAVLCLAGAVNRRARIIPRSGMFRCASLMISAERLFEISFAPGSTNARHKTRSVFELYNVTSGQTTGLLESQNLESLLQRQARMLMTSQSLSYD